jgi:hypothetical protein
MEDTLSDDLLFGAGMIARFLHGRDTKKNRRRVYHAHEHGYIPTWKEGDQIISTKTRMREHYKPPLKNSDG